MEQVGKSKAAKKLARQVAVRPVDLAHVDAAARIDAAPDAVELAFMARELVQCTLPHRDPGPLPVWSRRNGDLLLSVQPGVDHQGKLLPIPHATIPRLLLYWIVSEANRTKSRRLYPGRLAGDAPNNSLARFMREELGLDPSRGGVRSDRQRLKDGAESLFGCRMSFQRFTISGNFASADRLSMEVAPRSHLCWTLDGSPDQGTLPFEESYIELGEHFFTAITAAAVPVDLRVVREIKNSPLALDLYNWACHKAYTVNTRHRTEHISWAALMDQFGSEYKSVDEFARYARKHLRTIRGLWRKYDDGKTGLLLDFEHGRVRVRPGSLLSVPATPQQLDIEDAIARS